LLLTPLQEPTQPDAELQQALKVVVGNVLRHGCIVTR
jgi:hypothetical protein